MSNEKDFNCVEMKNRIQAEIMRVNDGLSDEESRQKRLEKLASEDSPAARIWQSGVKRRESFAHK